MKRILMTLFILSLGALVFGQYSKVVAIGDSLTAGFSSAGLVETFQVVSYPALVAGQVGIADFELPLVSEPGLPSLLELKSMLNENGMLSPHIAQITENPLEWGVPTNTLLPRPYDNLAVVGATLEDALETVSEDGMNYLVLRGLGTQVEQAISLGPDLLLVWIGSNDALGAAMMGTAIENVTLTNKHRFLVDYTQLLEVLTGYTSADIVLANVPDVTSIPFVTTLSPYIINPQTGEVVIGPDGHPMTYLGQNDEGGPFLSTDTYVLLTASEYLLQGYGVPAELGGRGEPLPDFVVLTPDETATIQEYISSYNESIESTAEFHGIPVIDMFSLIHSIKDHGLEVAGMSFNTDFLTGGIISYDGIHLTALGSAFIANYFIDAVNSHYSHAIPPVALAPFVFSSPVCCPGFGGERASTMTIRDLDPMLQLLTQHVNSPLGKVKVK